MFESANPARFHLYIESEDQNLTVLSFTGTEAISTPFNFRLSVSSDSDRLDVSALLHKPAYLAFADSGHGIHGLIYQVEHSSAACKASHYRIILRPHLANLAHRRHKRIFQQLSVPQILAQVLREHGLVEPAYAFHLNTDHLPRDHCVQYDESDLQFVQRLCEEEGLLYHFQHSRQGHQLLFSDGGTFRRIAPQHFDTLSDSHSTRKKIKHFGVMVNPDLSKNTIRAFGRSDQPQLTSGYFLPLNGHRRAEWNSLWLLTEVHHRYHQEPHSSLLLYSNRFRAHPWDQQFEAPTNYPKPRIQGCQTGRVIAHDPESSSRVKVQFDWSPLTRRMQANSCWASLGYGLEQPVDTLLPVLPPIESSVEVGFMNGDPDRPMVLGWQSAS